MAGKSTQYIDVVLRYAQRNKKTLSQATVALEKHNERIRRRNSKGMQNM